MWVVVAYRLPPRNNHGRIAGYAVYNHEILGTDFVSGGAGDDKLGGFDRDDTLAGGAEGDDPLHGCTGNGTMIGGEGADTFVLGTADGMDLIKDFTQSEDTVALVGDLTPDDIFLSQEDSVAIIQAGETTIRLNGVDADDLSEDDFLFMG
ncbi:MAG: hypothetical protein COB65_11330 [Thalassobium sp.]|nr:MAG: hypothetical protein COB65_11330 [Thalassobium sp.]